MTRGKHATSATARRAIETRESEIEIYQRKVRDLTAEKKELEAARQRDRAAHNETVRKLQAQLREGTSGALEAAHMRIEELRAKSGEAARYLRKVRMMHEKSGNAMILHFMNFHGMTQSEAMESVLNMSLDKELAEAMSAMGEQLIDPEIGVNVTEYETNTSSFDKMSKSTRDAYLKAARHKTAGGQF